MTLIRTPSLLTGLLLLALLLAVPQQATAHCDTLDGPVVMDATAALDKGDVTPVLKWIQPADEPTIRQAFTQTIKVRALNADARQLADNYFYETVVRVHRAGEGEPYTGLKPVGTEIDPGIAAADSSLATGEVGPVVKLVSDEVSSGIRARFDRARNLRAHMNESVERGREYTAAYVEYIHYVERLLLDASGKAVDHGEVPSDH